MGAAVVPEGVTVVPATPAVAIADRFDTALMETPVLDAASADADEPPAQPVLRPPVVEEPSGDWTMTPGATGPTIVARTPGAASPVEGDLDDGEQPVPQIDDAPILPPSGQRLPTGNWTIARVDDAPDGWSEPAKVEVPRANQRSNVGPPVSVVSGEKALESTSTAKQFEIEEATKSGLKVEIDATLTAPLIDVTRAPDSIEIAPRARVTDAGGCRVVVVAARRRRLPDAAAGHAAAVAARSGVDAGATAGLADHAAPRMMVPPAAGFPAAVRRPAGHGRRHRLLQGHGAAGEPRVPPRRRLDLDDRSHAPPPVRRDRGERGPGRRRRHRPAAHARRRHRQVDSEFRQRDEPAGDRRDRCRGPARRGGARCGERDRATRTGRRDGRDPGTEPVATECIVNITSSPAGAEIVNDKTSLGTTPTALSSRAGTRSGSSSARRGSRRDAHGEANRQGQQAARRPVAGHVLREGELDPARRTITVGGKSLGVTPTHRQAARVRDLDARDREERLHPRHAEDHAEAEQPDRRCDPEEATQRGR